jgi:hypothetical protein
MKSSVFIRSAAAVLLLSLYWARPASAQVSLAPTILVIDDRTHAGTLFLNNSSESPQEVEITMAFAYPVQMGSGGLVMVENDEEAAERYGIHERTRIFPRRFVMEGGGSRSVRVQVLPRAELPDGMYWSRLIVTSNAVTQDIETVETDGIGARFNYRLSQNIPVLYRKGTLTTGLDITFAPERIEEDRLIVTHHLERTGNSPFMGTYTARITNGSGEVVVDTWSTMATYFHDERALSFPLERFSSGVYTLELQYVTNRNDIAPGSVAQSQPVRVTHSIRIP